MIRKENDLFTQSQTLASIDWEHTRRRAEQERAQVFSGWIKEYRASRVKKRDRLNEHMPLFDKYAATERIRFPIPFLMRG